MDTIDRIEAPTIEFFIENYLKPNKPVIMTGVTDKWPAFSKWTPEYLAELSGDRPLNITRMINGDYVNSENCDMKLGDYIKELDKMTDDGDKLYLGELPMAQYLPELLEDVNPPAYFDKTEDDPKCFLYVGKSLFSQLHYHTCGSATLCPMHGYKKVRLYAPDQTKYLYKYPWYSVNHNMSKTISNTPDEKQFPKFSNAKYFDVTVSKGDMLFIPIYWWHAITNEDFNMAVVTFWGEKLFRRKPPTPLFMDYVSDVAKDVPDIASGIARKLLRSAGLSASTAK
jgi:Cupin-like domain